MYQKSQKDIAYKAKDIRSTQQKLRNAEAKSRSKRISFGQSTWLGFMRSVSPSQLPVGYGTLAVNVYPNGTYYEKSLGYVEVGRHVAGEIALNSYIGLVAGEIVVESINNIQNPVSKQSEQGLFKLIRSKENGETTFFVLGNDGFWKSAQPFADYWKTDQTGVSIPNKNASTPYTFKGSKFSFVVWKNTLYLCSGEEDFIGSNGKASGLMKWDGVQWDSIDCGKAGFLNNDYVNKSAFNGNIDIVDQSYRLYDSTKEFNPSLICLFKERLFIAGSINNPIQVKMSEWNNPDNFVDNVLGLQTAPLTSKDTARASSFILTTGADRINSINVFNDTIYIGTNKAFFVYTLVQQNIGNNVQFQLDAITQNNYTLAGSVNSYSTVAFQNKLYFLSDFHVIPELSNFEMTASGSSRPSASYQKISSSIDDFMYKVDLSNSCIGVYGDRVLIGCKYGSTDLSNNITIMASPFAIDNNRISWGFTVLDYIQPNYFFQNNRGCYFTSDDSGRLFKIVPAKFGVEVQEQDSVGNPLPIQYPASIFQTGWTGYDPAKDSSISKKRLNSLLLFGYFSQGTKINVTFIIESADDLESNKTTESKTITYTCNSEDIFNETDCSISQLMNVDIQRRYGAKYYPLHWNFSIGKDTITYKRISIRIDIEDSRYFLVENLVGIAEELSSDGNAGVTKPEFIDIDFALNSEC